MLTVESRMRSADHTHSNNRVEHYNMQTKVSFFALFLFASLAGTAYADNCPDVSKITGTGGSFAVSGASGISGSQWVLSTTSADVDLATLTFQSVRIQKENDETDATKKKDWAAICRYVDSNNEYVTLISKPNTSIKTQIGNWANVTTTAFDNEVRAKTKLASDATDADITAWDCVSSAPSNCTFQ